MLRTTELPWREVSEDDLAILSNIERRVLWLTTYLLHYIAMAQLLFT